MSDLNDRLDKLANKVKVNRAKVREMLDDELREVRDAAEEFITEFDALESALDSLDDLMESERYEGITDDREGAREDVQSALVNVSNAHDKLLGIDRDEDDDE